MNSTGLYRSRITVLLAFAGTLGVTWGVRCYRAPETGEEKGRRMLVPELQEAGRPVATKGVEPGELLSVRMGIVKLPPGGDVNEAFAGAWRELRAVVQAGSRDGDASNQEKARQLFADWWKVDPAAALRFVSEPPGMLAERGGLYLLPLVAERDVKEAWKLTDLAMERTDRMRARAEVVRAVAKQNTAGLHALTETLSHAQALQVAGEWSGFLAAKDPEAAMIWLASTKSGPVSWAEKQALRWMAHSLAEHDPAGFMGMVRSDSVDRGFFDGVLEGDGKDGGERAMRLARAQIANAADPLEFCQWASEKGGSRMAAAAWAAYLEHENVRTAEGIAALAKAMPQERLAAFCEGLGSAAPEAGLAWALANGAPLDGLVKKWAEIDAEKALAALRAAPASDAVMAAMRAAAAIARETAPVAALETMVLLPPQGGAKEAERELHSMVRRAAYTDPVQTLGVMGKLPNVTPEQVSMVLTAGAHRDPQATAAALAQVDLPVTDTVAAESFARGWAVADAEAASLWVRDLPPGEMREGAAAGLARTAARTDPDRALAWAVEVTQPEMRQNVLRSVVEAAVRAGTPLETLLAQPKLTDAERGTLRAHAAQLQKP